jgi:predicted phage tail protein
MIRRHAPAIYGTMTSTCYLVAAAVIAFAIMAERAIAGIMVWILVPVGVGLAFNIMWMIADRVKQREQEHAPV